MVNCERKASCRKGKIPKKGKEKKGRNYEKIQDSEGEQKKNSAGRT